MTSSRTLGATLLGGLVLSVVGCGAGSNDSVFVNPNPVPDTFVTAVQAIAANSPDNTEPVNIDALVATSPESTEPVNL